MPRKPRREPAQAAADELARQLMAAGHSPQDILAAITAAIEDRSLGFLPVRRQPEPRPAPEETRLFRLRVDLDGAQPPIWRRVEVRSDLTLDRVHDVLQRSLGWTNSHLHAFQIGPVRDHLVERFLTEYDLEEGDEGVLENDVRLDQVLVDVGDKLFYEYDFGDGWDHTLKLEAIEAYDDTQPAARVVAGRRSCPPEDCGGIGGYDEILAALADPDAADDHARQLFDWLPEDFEPDEFDLEAANAALHESLALGKASVLPERLAAPLAELVRRTPWDPHFALPHLVAAAELRDESLPGPEGREAMVRPFLRLLELAAGDGIPLTQAGYLKPAVVTELAGVLEVDHFWGKANREEHTFPVAVLRETAQTLRLVRRHKGRLVLSPAGRKVGGSTEAMWDLVVEALPLGKEPAEREAGALALLAVAAGEDTYDFLTNHGPQLLDDGGWRTAQGPVTGYDAYDLARATVDALRLLCKHDVLSRPRPPQPDLRMLARAALRC